MQLKHLGLVVQLMHQMIIFGAYLPKQHLCTFGDNYLIVKSMFTSLKMFPLLKRIRQFYQDIVLSYKSKFFKLVASFAMSVLSLSIRDGIASLCCSVNLYVDNLHKFKKKKSKYFRSGCMKVHILSLS